MFIYWNINSVTNVCMSQQIGSIIGLKDMHIDLQWWVEYLIMNIKLSWWRTTNMSAPHIEIECFRISPLPILNSHGCVDVPSASNVGCFWPGPSMQALQEGLYSMSAMAKKVHCLRSAHRENEVLRVGVTGVPPKVEILNQEKRPRWIERWVEADTDLFNILG